jgi:ferredoxin-thioredoxin reductase catalytic subunit
MVVYAKIVAENGITVVPNHNEKLLEKIKQRCELNNNYCPCHKETDEDHLCPCKNLRMYGECCCNMYEQLLCG